MEIQYGFGFIPQYFLFIIYNHCTILMSTRLRSIGIYLLKILLLAVIYRIAAVLGLSMAYVQANTSPVWPPTGIALAALLLFGIKLWPGVALGVLFGSLFTGAPIPLAIGMTFGNTLEAVLGAYLLRRFLDFHNTLDRTRDVIGLSLVSFIATMLSATFGAVTLSLIENPYGRTSDRSGPPGGSVTYWARWLLLLYC